MLARDLHRQLKGLYTLYTHAIDSGSLGEALAVRDDIGRLVLREMDTFYMVFKFFDDPLHAGDDNVPQDDNVPF